MKDQPRKTKGTKLAEELRAVCNKLTPAERERYHRAAMKIINERGRADEAAGRLLNHETTTAH